MKRIGSRVPRGGGAQPQLRLVTEVSHPVQVGHGIDVIKMHLIRQVANDVLTADEMSNAKFLRKPDTPDVAEKHMAGTE